MRSVSTGTGSLRARRPDETPDVVWDALKTNASKPRRSWLDVFEAAIEQDDHLASGAVLPLAQQLADDRRLEIERMETMDRARQELRKSRGEVLLARPEGIAVAGGSQWRRHVSRYSAASARATVSSASSTSRFSIAVS